MSQTTYEMFGKYILLEKIAAGGMAEVFLSRALGAGGIGKFLAIKRILPQFSEIPEFIDMFKGEAKIAINLSHSNVVSIYEYGLEKEQYYLVMDYVEGRNLRQILNKMKKSNSTFSIDQIVFICKEVAAGLDHAHRCLDGATGKPLNITHRDMSPQNVMLSYEGEVKIVDFGIAKAESQLETTRAGTLKGKFGYMSPEQAEGQPVDLRTDVFSLGIVLWEMLANDRLFIANNEINTLRKIKDCQIPNLRKINPNIHSELERIVIKALTKDRNLRYQTAAAMHRDLSRFLNRQYPDFSPHDFSVFIKTLFADEILENRRRLIEYAKVTPNNNAINSTSTSRIAHGPSIINNINGPRFNEIPQNERNIPVHRTLTNAHTNDQPIEEFQLEKEILSNDIDVSDSSNSNEFELENKNQFEFESNEEKTPLASKRTSNDHSNPPPPQPPRPKFISEMGALRSQQNHENTNKNIEPSNSGIDDQALFEAMQLHQKQLEEMEENEANQENNINTNENKNGVTFKTFSSGTQSRIKTVESEGPSLFQKLGNIALFAFLILMAYSFCVKFYTPQMLSVIQITDPYLNKLHMALGVDYKNHVSMASQPSLESDIKNKTIDTKNETLTASVDNSDSDDLSQFGSSSELLISSSPSGAEIYLNGVNTGRVTPSKIIVPSNDKFVLSLKRTGYVDYEKSNMLKSELGRRFSASLQKALVGFINIDVIPPRQVKLYVNGKKLNDEGLPLYNYAVPAETWVNVKAIDPIGGLSAEQKIFISQDQKKSLILQLKKKKQNKSN